MLQLSSNFHKLAISSKTILRCNNKRGYKELFQIDSLLSFHLKIDKSKHYKDGQFKDLASRLGKHSHETKCLMMRTSTWFFSES